MPSALTTYARDLIPALRRERLKAGWSQETLSQMTGGAVRRSRIAQFELGQAKPSPIEAKLLSAALNQRVTEADLLGA